MSKDSCHRRAQRGFTLVELLVVIGIIALLISLLLPALNRARRSANTVACAANIRSIIQGFQMYAAGNRGYFPGTITSGGFLFKADYSSDLTYPNDNSFCPDIIQNWDWMSPVAKMMGVKFNEGGAWMERLERFERLRIFPAFQCPENTVLAVPVSFANANPGPGTGGPTVSVERNIAYNMSSQFHLLPHKPGVGIAGRTHGSADATSPQGYSPQFAKVRNSSQKILIGDGARFSRPDQAPNISLAFRSSGGGAFADAGAFWNGSSSWNRSHAPGNTPSQAGNDARIYAYRHGAQTQRQSADMYKANFGFFDGHVELLGDLQSANPAYWFPSGSTYSTTGALPISADVSAKYSMSGTVIIP